ncbi:M20/M25/M40 family metallo-hydrolase [Thauera humireducens]|uniref:M20/M25/M40 family metallo-hydrolase n=1 Tax=Thauera humireducens TaxID=1134435 RepID=UPI00311F94B1
MTQVDGSRLIGMQRTLASFGGREDGGVAREALTATEREARRWLIQQVSGPRYSWHVDAAANLFLRRAGTDDSLPPVMTGSHIDTQPVGGWLDGAYGVIAGLEALLALDSAGIDTRHPIELAIWTNEEGSASVQVRWARVPSQSPRRWQPFWAAPMPAECASRRSAMPPWRRHPKP